METFPLLSEVRGLLRHKRRKNPMVKASLFGSLKRAQNKKKKKKKTQSGMRENKQGPPAKGVKFGKNSKNAGKRPFTLLKLRN